MELLPGVIIRSQSGFYTVETGDGQVVCRLRGRLKLPSNWLVESPGDIIAVGDRVKISVQPDGSGMVEEIEPRVRELVRLAPTPRGEYRQLLLANPDQVAMVFACAQPFPRQRMLDRFLVICERQNIPAIIVANKVDLIGLEAAHALFSIYPPLGYTVIYTSVKTGLGVDELHQHLKGHLTGFAGPSGVGKTSLLNAIQPDLGLAVREVSQANEKGRHTTNVRQMFPLPDGGYVADLPGLRILSLWDIEPEELDGYFPEISPLVSECQFSDCTHRDEPGCAVRAAARDGLIHPDRYESYLRLRFGEEES